MLEQYDSMEANVAELGFLPDNYKYSKVIISVYWILVSCVHPTNWLSYLALSTVTNNIQLLLHFYLVNE